MGIKGKREKKKQIWKENIILSTTVLFPISAEENSFIQMSYNELNGEMGTAGRQPAAPPAEKCCSHPLPPSLHIWPDNLNWVSKTHLGHLQQAFNTLSHFKSSWNNI